MPLYEYKCLKCGRRTEKIETFKGPHLKKCPHCGGKVEALISAPAIQFKGSGWYVTDYAGKSKGSDGGSSEKGSSGESKETASKDSGGGKDSGSKDSGAKDTKSSKDTKKDTSSADKKSEKHSHKK